MSGPHKEVERENTRLRKEVRLLREESEVLKKAATTDWQGIAMSREVSLQVKAGEVRLYRSLERSLAC